MTKPDPSPTDPGPAEQTGEAVTERAWAGLRRASPAQELEPTEQALAAIADALRDSGAGEVAHKVTPHEVMARRVDWPPFDQPIARFSFNETKTVEALVLVAKRWPGITPFYVAKALFFADRDHLRAYGRPVTGDRYIAMAAGPVPSRVYDMVKGNLDFFGDPNAIVEAIRIDRNDRVPRLYSNREPDLDLLSETDIEALTASVDFCRGKSFRELSELTHQEPAWAQAPANGEMNPEMLVPEDMREEVREAAAYAVL